MMTVSGVSSPSASAASSMARAMRSFTEPPGLKDSTLPMTVAPRPRSRSKWVSSTRGVLPMSSDTLRCTFMRFLFLSCVLCTQKKLVNC